jgi:site-specific DNA-methyltransferase (adenine-specific)
MTRLVLHHGDCVSVLQGYGDGTVGGVVSDPPYGLRFMSKAFDDLGDGAAQREWHKAWLTEAFRVLRPGGVIKAFSGTRTFHHLGAAMADVGFVEVGLEAYIYGSGFPKSLNVSVAIDKSFGAERKVIGYKRGTGADPSTGRKDMPGKAVGVKQVAIDVPTTAPATEEAAHWEGWGTALKPAWEPVVVGRKPL